MKRKRISLYNPKLKERARYLESLGVRFLRFLDEDVRHNMEGVLNVIERWHYSE